MDAELIRQYTLIVDFLGHVLGPFVRRWFFIRWRLIVRRRFIIGRWLNL